MERLAKSWRRLVWLNPLLRYADFEARPAGIRAMLPWVDDFLPVHNLASLEALDARCRARSSRGTPPIRGGAISRRSARGEGARCGGGLGREVERDVAAAGHRDALEVRGRPLLGAAQRQRGARAPRPAGPARSGPTAAARHARGRSAPKRSSELATRTSRVSRAAWMSASMVIG
jgi:hypothetical protein